MGRLVPTRPLGRQDSRRRAVASRSASVIPQRFTQAIVLTSQEKLTAKALIGISNTSNYHILRIDVI